MNIWAKLGMVICGYVLACLVASGAMYINGLLTPADVKIVSSGMTAFEDLILFIGGFCALFPTVLGTYFLVRGFMSRQSNKV